MMDRDAMDTPHSVPVPLDSGGSAPDGTRLPHSIFAVMVLAAIAQSVFSYPQLPDRLASHFAASGAPNGWMTKEAFFLVYAVLIGLAAIMEFYPARSIARSSTARMNLPNKEYWLAPERRAATFGYFKQYFAWYGCAVLLTEVIAIGLAIQANLNPPPRMPLGPMMALIAGFMLFSVISLIHLFRRFSKTS